MFCTNPATETDAPEMTYVSEEKNNSIVNTFAGKIRSSYMLARKQIYIIQFGNNSSKNIIVQNSFSVPAKELYPIKARKYSIVIPHSI